MTTIDDEGVYRFRRLPAGTYTVRLVCRDRIVTSPGAYVVNLPFAGSAERNFGLAGGRISGLAFVDKNQNGRRDDGEPPLNGEPIDARVFIDANNDGSLQDVEQDFPILEDGTYILEDVAAGQHVVRTTPIPGHTPTTASSYIVNLALGETQKRHFGLYTPPVPGSIAGAVFHDLDDDGRFDLETDVGLLQWNVYLDFDRDGRYDGDEPQRITDINGNFSFDGLAPGAYRLGMRGGAGLYLTTPPFYDIQIQDDVRAKRSFGISSTYPVP